MAYEIGTANGHQDLLNKIATFVTTNSDLVSKNQNWEILQQTATSYQFKAPGLSTKERIYCGVDLVGNVQKDYYNMRVFCARGFDNSQPVHLQPYTAKHVLLLWNKAIKYWLVANGQRLIIVAKISTNYEIGYLGKFFPYATPGQYPYPVLTAGTCGKDDARWDLSDGEHSSIQCPGGNTATVYLADGSRQSLMNRGGNDKKLRNASFAYTSPTCLGGIACEVIQKNPDGTFTLIPYIVGTPKDGGNLLGELDGIYWVTGHSNASENIVTIGNIDHIVIQNTYRTSWQDYCAIALA